MTIQATLAAIKAAGMHGKRDSETGEYRVTYPYGELPDDVREDCAYYTGDAQDAVDTARAMRAQRDAKAA